MFESVFLRELLLFILFPGGIICFFGTMVLRQWIMYFKTRKYGVHGTGEVIGSFSETNAEGNEVFNAIIRFTDQEGVNRSFNTDFIFGRRPKPGMKARIIYNYYNPDEAYFNRRGELFFLCLISIFLLGVSAFLIRYMVVRYMQLEQ
jgi:hypothetical protein